MPKRVLRYDFQTNPLTRVMSGKYAQFVFWLFVFMFLIGLAQVGMGVFRVYQASEIAYQLSSPHVDSKNTKEKIDRIKQLLISRRPAIENYIRTLPASRATEFTKTVNDFIKRFDTEGVIQPFYNIRSAVPEKEEPARKKARVTHDHHHTWDPIIREIPEGNTSEVDYIETLTDVLLSSFFHSKLWAFDTLIDHDRIHPRGQMKNHSIIMSAHIGSLDELAKVFVHEIAHIIDIYALKRSGVKADPSTVYYDVSWEDVDTQKTGSRAQDFVSGYGATNQYEDFAEAFTFYVFHNQTFLDWAEDNRPLQEKYDFLQSVIFGSTFKNSAYEDAEIPTYIWDTTKVTLQEQTLQELFQE